MIQNSQSSSRKSTRATRLALGATLAFLGAAVSGVARGQVVTEFPLPTANCTPEGIVSGPDGNLWFGEETCNAIGRMTLAGVVTQFPLPNADSGPETVAVGPDGNLWFTEVTGNRIGRITPNGVITEFPIPTAGSMPEGIAAGPDGNIWFTERNKIGRITTSGVITEFPIPTVNPRGEGMAMGPDGNMWFVENAGNKVGRITTAGVITEFPIPTADAEPWNITAGADGNMWFSEGGAGNVARITMAGVITEYPVPGGGTPDYLTLGPDGNVWFTEYHGDQIGRITPAGVVTEFPLGAGTINPYGITTGTDGALWFPETGADKIGRITTAAAVPKAMIVDGSGNAVFESGESGPVAPEWENTLTSSSALTGAASDLTGPGGPNYSTVDAAADYGTVAAESTASCGDTGNCYTMSVSGARPAPHWDASFTETISPGPITKTWSLHIGESFTDVTTAHSFYSFIETLFHSGVTGGCGPGSYCPDSSVTRGQMAVFILKAKLGSQQLVPPATGTVFFDVPTSTQFASWIESLAGFQITGGCGGGNYCPATAVNRGQMAAFLLKAKHGSSYVPPNCTGVFADVNCPNHQFVNWIEQLAEEGITGGCGGSNYCPENPITRGQMAVFLTKTFGLQLYGP